MQAFSPSRWLPALAALSLALPLRADTQLQPLPPGRGMIDQPCPRQIAGLWSASPYVRKYDWAWLCRYRAANAALDPRVRPQAVFIGDSITEGWIDADPGFFASGNLDRGISGQTSPQMLLRFMQDVVALRPRVVHIIAGTNDVAGNTGPTDIAAYQDNVRAMVALARANGIAVVLGSIPPADRFNSATDIVPAPRIAALNAWLRQYAREQGLIYADYFAALTGPNGELPARYSADGLHPNAAGYAVMRPIAERAITQALAQAAPLPAPSPTD